MLPNDVITRDCILVTDNGKKIPLRIDRIDFDPYTIVPEITGYLMIHKEISVSQKNNSLIKKVIFNDPATIVIWSDDTKTIVKCQPGDTYSEELGLAMCISKKYLGNKGNFNDEFKKWLPEEKIPNYDIPVEGMRDKLCDFCETIHCDRCVLEGDTCRCGFGVHFKSTDTFGHYRMSDDEIRDAYHRVFGKKED